MSERDVDGYYHVDCELSDNIVKHRYWSLPSNCARLLTDGHYELEGFNEPVLFARFSSGNNRIKRFLSKILTLGLKAGDRFELAINPEARRMRVTKIDIRSDFLLEPPPSGI
ncbi:hypothetical protein LZ012_14055 [Dechloromonas sp. XY25]|uniref:Uncharacterized protein n=1 Tax=Dechloromonas hankyongensis TaxID=2908002 RepID=A0ABS9K4L4_9RHOO|nr:hypothetical protein [Dechloromonas hankyongensis]MCG2578114.1 hypothetical protein [Dechloromonas hankyongensis]